MPTARITQNVVEVLVSNYSKARVTQTLVEVLVNNYSKARLSQTVIEVFQTFTTTSTTTTTTVPLQLSKVVGYATVSTLGVAVSKALGYAALVQSTTTTSTTTTTTTATTTSTTVPGSVVYGHDTAVEEDFVEDFTGKWEGTATISGGGDAENLRFYVGQGKKLIAPHWYGTDEAVIRLNKYQSGDDVSVYYKTGGSLGVIASLPWSEYVGKFTSQGFVDVRLLRGTLTTTSTTQTFSTTTTSTVTTSTTAPSNLFVTDFTEASPLDDWTDEWGKGSDYTLSIVTAANDARVGTSDLNILGTGVGSRRGFTYDPVGSNDDSEILTLVNISDLNGIDQGLRMFLRLGGSAGTEDAYLINFYGSADTINLGKYIAGVYTSIISTLVYTFDASAKPVWIRFSVVGTAIKVKMWNYDSQEPAEWGIDETDSSLTTGRSGLGQYFNDNVDVMYFGVSNDGGTVPIPDLTYGGPVDTIVPIGNFRASDTVSVDFCRFFSFEVTAQADGKYIKRIRAYAGTLWTDVSRLALYKGADPADLTDATLVEDFGIVDFTASSWNYITLSPYVQVSTGDVLYIGIKSDNVSDRVIYNQNKLKASCQLVNDTGRWDATSDLGKDETVAFPANLSAATGATRVDTWYLFGLSYGVSTTTTT